MRVSRAFCSQVSQQVGEQHFATASRGAVWLLLEHPGPWGLEPPYDTVLPAPAKRYLVRLLQSIPSSRLLLIKRERGSGGPLSLFVAVARERGPSLHAFTFSSYDDLPGIDVAGLTTGQLPPESGAERALFLVCTDGKHDYCCAKFGLSIYQRMTSYAADTVYQASHVGGDRFAANVACFPHGLFYGHIASEDVQPMVDAFRDGHVYMTKYRGRTCYPFVVQAAEYFVRLESGITETDGLQLVESARLDEHTWRAEFSSPADARVHQVMLHRELSAFSSYLTCKADEPERVPQYQMLSYRAFEARDRFVPSDDQA